MVWKWIGRKCSVCICGCEYIWHLQMVWSISRWLLCKSQLQSQSFTTTNAPLKMQMPLQYIDVVYYTSICNYTYTHTHLLYKMHIRHHQPNQLNTSSKCTRSINWPYQSSNTHITHTTHVSIYTMVDLTYSIDLQLLIPFNS